MDVGNLLKNKWGWIVGGIILLVVIIVIADENEEKSAPTNQLQFSQEQPSQKNQLQSLPDKIETLADFENSQFCRDFKCNKGDSWQLSSGGINHFYSIPLGGDKYNYITIEIVTENKQVTEFGLMYFDREVSGLSPSDLEIAYKLLNSIDSTDSIDSVKNYIIQNIEQENFQIRQVSPILWGTFNVYAGKIGQQTISIERVK